MQRVACNSRAPQRTCARGLRICLRRHLHRCAWFQAPYGTPILISMASPAASVASVCPAVRRTATDRPLQLMWNDSARHCGGSRGSIASISPLRSTPPNPSTTACHIPPKPAMRTPPAVLGRGPIESRGLAQIAQSRDRIADACSDQGVHGRAERAAVRAAWLVVAEVDRGRLAREFPWQQSDQRHHVSLLDDLRALCALAADHDVDRHRVMDIGRQIKRFPLVEACELLIQASCQVEASRDAGGSTGGSWPIGATRLEAMELLRARWPERAVELQQKLASGRPAA